ncbi:O-antigen ligase family protein [Emcibacter sp.]|uniref:O-antigen ligase family protein n=1 Tax=Emcibacter sp. TaxID=1979954 RepID=UPI002AA8F6D4|nr:O-antigen ligase family protein [Emcibacter sp.]
MQILFHMENLIKNFSRLSPLGKLLCGLLILLPLAVLFLHPNTLLPPGPKEFAHATVAEIIFISGYILFRRSRGYDFWIIPLPVWLCFGLWLLASCLSLSSAADYTEALHKLAQYLFHFFFAVTLISYLLKERQEISAVYSSLLLSLYLMLLLFLITTAIMSQSPHFNWTLSLPGFSNLRHLDYILAVMLSATIMLPFSLKDGLSGRWRIFFLVALTLLWLLLCWTGARGSILSSLIATGICLFVMRKHSLTRQLLVIFLLTMISGALISLALPIPDGNYGLIRFATSISEYQDFNKLSSNRVSIWLEALEKWCSSPWVGAGAGQTIYIIESANKTFVQPHNVVVQALLAWGIIGGSGFIGIITGILWNAYRHATERMRHNPAAIAGLGMMLTIAANAMIDGTLYHPVPFFLFLMGSGLALTPPAKAH